MANERQTTYATGNTLYFRITDKATGKMWNTATPGFETPATANVLHYVNTGTEQDTTGIYWGTMPTGIGARLLKVEWLLCAGGSPATSHASFTDTVVDREDPIQWNGTADLVPPLYAVPLRVLSETFSAATNGINNDMDGRVAETGQPWQQLGDLFVVNGRCTSLSGTPNAAVGTDSYVSDHFTLTAVLNPNGDTEGDAGVAFRGDQSTLLSGNCWMCLLDCQAGLLKLGTYTASGGFVSLKSAALQPGTSTYINTSEHTATIRCNGPLITAVLDGPFDNEGGGGGICAVAISNSTYQSNTYCGMVSNVIYGLPAGQGKYFARITLDTPTPAVLMGAISGVTPGNPIKITSTAHGLAAGNLVNVYNVHGTTGADKDRWPIAVVDADNFTLTGSNDSHAYTGGGFWMQVLTGPPYPFAVGSAPIGADANRVANVLFTDASPVDMGMAGTLGFFIGAATYDGSNRLKTSDPWATPEPGSYAPGTFGYLNTTSLGRIGASGPINITSNLSASGTLLLMRNTDYNAAENNSIDVPVPAWLNVSTATSFALNISGGRLIITSTSYVTVAGIQKARFQPTRAQTKLLSAQPLHQWAATATFPDTDVVGFNYGALQVISAQDGS